MRKTFYLTISVVDYVVKERNLTEEQENQLVDLLFETPEHFGDALHMLGYRLTNFYDERGELAIELSTLTEEEDTLKSNCKTIW